MQASDGRVTGSLTGVRHAHLKGPCRPAKHLVKRTRICSSSRGFSVATKAFSTAGVKFARASTRFHRTSAKSSGTSFSLAAGWLLMLAATVSRHSSMRLGTTRPVAIADGTSSIHLTQREGCAEWQAVMLVLWQSATWAKGERCSPAPHSSITVTTVTMLPDFQSLCARLLQLTVQSHGKQL